MSDTFSDNNTPVHDALAAAIQAEKEHDEYTRRAERAERQLVGAKRHLEKRRSLLVTETQDVERLESFSPTKIWAALRGTHAQDLEREKAEQQQAHYAVAEAANFVTQLETEQAAALNSAAALGDVTAKKTQALNAVELWITTNNHPQAARLTELAATIGTVAGEQHELLEAITAADEAQVALGNALVLLSSAQGWSTYDTFFGGGIITDMVKYDKMDQAQRLMQLAGSALQRLQRELTDVAANTQTPSLEISSLLNAFDVWFDNVFSDWMVRDRIVQARGEIERARTRVAQIREELTRRYTAAGETLTQAHTERETLLVGYTL